MNEFRGPRFLKEKNDSPTQRIRCPVHGFIHYSENERKIIDHPLFRRLRFIRQLALTEYVYPGATHSRFEHSLGVMEVATQAFDSLAARHGATMEARFGDIPAFKAKPLAKARQALRLAALAHDLGHAPFCHVAESAILGPEGHEGLTVRIVKNEGVDGIKKLLDGSYWEGCSDTVAQIISRELPPQLKVLSDLISGEMDADRTDYLLRDSLHCGVDYGRFDYRRMIESLELWQDPTGRLEIAIHRAGMHTFEALILARYQMNTQVYYHRLRRIYDYYLNEYVTSLGKKVFGAPETALAENDLTMLTRIWRDGSTGKASKSKWAERVSARRHHRVVHDTGVNADAAEIIKSTQLFAHLKQTFKNVDFIHDIAGEQKPVGIHKIRQRGDKYRQDTQWIDLRVVLPGRKDKSMADESQVLSSIPREFQVARIFADTTSSSSKLHENIAAEADRIWREM